MTHEARERGVRLLYIAEGFHAKFLLWGDDDIVVTSLNWGSWCTSPDFPQGDAPSPTSGVQLDASGNKIRLDASGNKVRIDASGNNVRVDASCNGIPSSAKAVLRAGAAKPS